MEYRDRRIEERYKNRWYGKYRAFVRDNNDPERLGRVRMEIPAVLGVGSDNVSDWAYPCFPYGGNEDNGMFFVPEEGASVWAEFEGGIVQHPIWTGVWLAKSTPGEQPEESKSCMNGPRMKVLLKTETGHTILADDTEGQECLKLIDRAGQTLHMAGKVKSTVQAGNSRKRVMKSAERGDQLSVASDMVGQQGRIELTDICRQSLCLEGRKGKEQVRLQSCEASRGRWQQLALDTTQGKEQVHLLGLNGQQEVLIDSSAGREKVLLRDKAGQSLCLNAAQGAITLLDKSGQQLMMDGKSEQIGLTDRAESRVILDGRTSNVLIQSTALTLINP